MIKGKFSGTVKELERIRNIFSCDESVVILSNSELIPFTHGKAKGYYRWFVNFDFMDAITRRERFKNK